MGYYIDCEDGRHHDKAIYLISNHNAKAVNRSEAEAAMANPDLGVICIKDNGFFEAAGFMFSNNEFKAFADPYDVRPTTWLTLDRKTAKELSGYTGT